MSRRVSKEKKKIDRNTRREERKKNLKNELVRVILACEGTVTESNYFRSIFRELINNHNIAKTSLIIVKHSHTDPKGVLSDLEKALENDDEFEHKWIVIDRDEMQPNGGGHEVENFNGAISSANAKGIQVAYSNPSFELWYLLHFEYRNSPIDRDAVIKELKKYVDYTKNSQTIYQEILPLQEVAIANAKRLKATYEVDSRKVNPTIDNPSTTVFELVEVLNGLKK
jgi:hypothetical protein